MAHSQNSLGQFNLEGHGGRTPAGIYARVAQRLLALTAAIWHNWCMKLPDRVRPLNP